MREHVLTLHLRDDAASIAEYEAHHAPGSVWPEVQEALRQSGILALRIYRSETLLVMVLHVSDDFSFEAKAAADAANPVVQRWERLMERFQQAGGPAKWRPMTRIYDQQAGAPDTVA